MASKFMVLGPLGLWYDHIFRMKRIKSALKVIESTQISHHKNPKPRGRRQSQIKVDYVLIAPGRML